MEPGSLYPALLFLAFALVAGTRGDIDERDKKSLLDFIADVPHGRKLNWDSETPVCGFWVGITCSRNGSKVTAVRLPGIGLIGPIPPATLGKLDSLETLSLRSNRLSGSLPNDLLSIPSLRYLYLQNNLFSGDIPSSLSPRLTVLDLSLNSFTGVIPESVRNLIHLTGLYLHKNSLAGTIPDILRLESLNLSYNRLRGPIPKALGKFSVSCFEGNPGLCGLPLHRCVSLSPSPSPEPSRGSKRKPSANSIATITGLVLVFLAIVAITILCQKRRQKTRESDGAEKPKSTQSRLVFFEGCNYEFDLEDLLRASAEVLGKGSFGTSYKAIMEDGTAVVIKRLKEIAVGKREFEQEMEKIGRVGWHENVVALRAYVHTNEETLLLYDYVPGGSFSALIHGNRESETAVPDQETRRKIFLDCARGIAHIHRENLVHGNIKSSNILLVSEGARVSDFGLALLMKFPAIPSRSVGYLAPEARKFTRKSDVFAFGVLLLEVLTGEAPVPSPGRDSEFDLSRWIASEVWCGDRELVEIAMACVARVPEMRPEMDEVVAMIEDIRAVAGE